MTTLSMAFAGEHVIELKEDKTIIHPELLGYNENTTLKDVLLLLPELISRTTGWAIANYSVQLDDKDVGDAKDVVLLQTRLVEIDCIEVSNSPTVSEQVNGHGGTINVKLRNPEEGTHGTTSLGLSTYWSVQPSLYLTHKKDKFTLRSTMLFEYDAVNDDRDREILRKRDVSDLHRTLFLENEKRYADILGQTVKLDMRYDFDAQNTLKFWAFENGAFNNGTSHMEAESHTALTKDTVFYYRFGRDDKHVNNRDIFVSALAEFEHQYKAGGSLVINAGYNYHPTFNYTLQDADGAYFSGKKNAYNIRRGLLHEFTGKVESKHTLPIANQEHDLQFKYGVNVNYSRDLSEKLDSVWWNLDAPSILAETQYNVNTLYASPFIEWTYGYRGLKIQAGVRYQYYSRDFRLEQRYGQPLLSTTDTLINPNETLRNHDVSASLNVTYEFSKQHRLRMIAARNLVRPDNTQAYPNLMIDWGSMTAYEKCDLKNAHTYNVDLDYVFDWEQDGHRLFLNTGLNYIFSNNIIGSSSERWDVLPDLQRVLFFNGGTSHQGSAELGLSYRYAGFSMCFSGNTFFSKDMFYYNLSLSPIYSFPKDWHLAGQLAYYSKVHNGQTTLGDCFYAQIRLHKNIRNWMVYLELADIFDYRTTDIVNYSENEYMKTSYDLYRRSLAVGFTYKF